MLYAFSEIQHTGINDGNANRQPCEWARRWDIATRCSAPAVTALMPLLLPERIACLRLCSVAVHTCMAPLQAN